MEAKLAILGDSSEGNGQLSGAQAAELAGNPAWQRSGFESLERFIFEFLTGGAQAGAGTNGSDGGRVGAESVRLKLEASASRARCSPCLATLRCLQLPLPAAAAVFVAHNACSPGRGRAACGRAD